jgi:hypothetical protein
MKKNNLRLSAADQQRVDQAERRLRAASQQDILNMLADAIDQDRVEFADDDGVFRGNRPYRKPL